MTTNKKQQQKQDLRVFKLTNHVFDVFWGEGFYQWARVKWAAKDNKPTVVAKNEKLPKDFRRKLISMKAELSLA